jgi:HK97 family phage prohead protease
VVYVPEKEIRCARIEDIEIRSDEKPTIRGYAAVFDSLSGSMGWFREKIAPGAFRWSLEHKKNIYALWNHDTNYPVGSTKSGQLKLEEDSKGLFFELQPIDTNAGRDLSEMIRSGVVGGVSFGFYTKKQEWDETDPKNPIRTLQDVDLIEISPTAFPAYPQTMAAIRSEEQVWKEHLAEQGLAGDIKESEQRQEPIDVIRAQIEILKQLQEETKK